MLASGGEYEDDTIKLWDVNPSDTNFGACLQTLTGHIGGVTCVAFAPDGLTLASSSSYPDHTIKLWDMNKSDGNFEDCLLTLNGYINSVLAVSYAPDGKTLVSMGANSYGLGVLKLWDVGQSDAHYGDCLQTFTGQPGNLYSVACSPDGQTLASGGEDDTIKLWRASDGACLQTLTGHTYFVHSVAFAPDGQTLASGSWDGTVRLWRVSDGACLNTL